MSTSKTTKAFRDKVSKIQKKRPRLVAEHILRYGHITTDELNATYGYRHPPRAPADLKDEGIPLDGAWIRDTAGERRYAYTFSDPKKARTEMLSGRRPFPKSLKNELLQRDGAQCAICLRRPEQRYLQIDHRVPFRVVGDVGDSGFLAEDFMLVCAPCNRAKSWSCEHCRNWMSAHDVTVCESCYWASPCRYSHVALEASRHLEVTWAGVEVQDYDAVASVSQETGEDLQSLIKRYALEGALREQ